MTIADVLTDRAAVILQDRPVVPLRDWMAVDGRALQVVTPTTSRLSIPLSLALGESGSRWVVSEDGLHYDGLTGVPLLWDGSHFAQDPTANAHAPAYLVQSKEPVGAQIVITMETRTDPGHLLGGAVEQLCRAVTGQELTSWGPAEPAGFRWDRARYTEALTGRTARAIVASNTALVASVAVQSHPDGTHTEVFTAVTGFKDPSTAPAAQVPSMLATVPGVMTAGAQVRFGRSDLTIEPRWLGAPVPIKL